LYAILYHTTIIKPLLNTVNSLRKKWPIIVCYDQKRGGFFVRLLKDRAGEICRRRGKNMCSALLTFCASWLNIEEGKTAGRYAYEDR
jgi:hypothetical protein